MHVASSIYERILTCKRCYNAVVNLPSFFYERELTEKGHYVVGVDEVGCGCLAGPVIAAAVHLPLNSRIGEINDSKLLSPDARYKIFSKFVGMGLKFTVGLASVSEIDNINIRHATYLAMKRAIDAFSGATFALIDAWTVPDIGIMQKGIIHGDRIVKSIAAASIIAKVVRDRLMTEFEDEYKGYFFAKHKGYGTRLHYSALSRLGPSALHRKTFLRKLSVLE